MINSERETTLKNRIPKNEDKMKKGFGDKI